jgi:transposase/DNA-directed RNA polymerase subunit RPC12/RpoP
MALINCPECNGKISTSAITCPHCGFVMSNMKVKKQDPLFELVSRFVVETNNPSISNIQKEFELGFNRVQEIVNLLEKNNIISNSTYFEERKVLLNEDELDIVIKLYNDKLNDIVEKDKFTKKLINRAKEEIHLMMPIKARALLNIVLSIDPSNEEAIYAIKRIDEI